jgi:hypothetical protein
VHWSRPFPIIIAFAQQRRARLPHPLSLAFLTGPCFDASSSLRSRSGPQSCSPLDQAHPLRGSRDFYTRAFLTAGHPTAKSGITTQLSGLLLRRNLHPLGKCCYGLQLCSAELPPSPSDSNPLEDVLFQRVALAAKGR